MQIVKTTLDEDHFLVANKKGFIYIFRGMDSNFSQPFRMLNNIAFGLEENEGMEKLIHQLQGALIKEIGFQSLVNLSLRKICEKYEFKEVREFYWTMTKDEQEEFINFFGLIHTFKQRPVIGFRNKNGIEFQ